jgi:hypothetical protein
VRAAEESARGGWRGAGEEERDEGAGERGLGVGRRLEKDESRGELVGEGWEELAEELETQELRSRRGKVTVEVAAVGETAKEGERRRFGRTAGG